jgi:hypothetical protein
MRRIPLFQSSSCESTKLLKVTVEPPLNPFPDCCPVARVHHLPCVHRLREYGDWSRDSRSGMFPFDGIVRMRDGMFRSRTRPAHCQTHARNHAPLENAHSLISQDDSVATFQALSGVPRAVPFSLRLWNALMLSAGAMEKSRSRVILPASPHSKTRDD